MEWIVGGTRGISLHVEDCRTDEVGCNMCSCWLLVSDEVMRDVVVRGDGVYDEWMGRTMSGFNE